MKLVITEKPSVAKSISAVLSADKRRDGYFEGENLLISWCFGHLAELASAEVYDEAYARWSREQLPIIPKSWQYSVGRDKKKQLDLLTELMRRSDVTEIINACDAGREGELIFRTVYLLAGCVKPVKRLWISSMEDAAIREGFENLRDGSEYDHLYDAALCRSKADWLVGINATRLFSVLYHRTLNVGRVVSPTLALLVQREAEIKAFQPEPFYTVKLDADNFAAVSEKLKNKPDAENLKSACAGALAVIRSVEQKEKSEKAPALYDLTTLQRDANRILGFTAQQTLDYLQSLYEKKLCTYPRTDSRYLTHDMEAGLPELASRVCGVLPFADGLEPAIRVEAVINDAKVTDHHALIPTTTMPGQEAAIRALTTGEHDLLFLVCARLLCALDNPCVYEETVLHIECAGHDFTAKGKRIVQMGWKRIWCAFRGSIGAGADEKDADNPLTIPEEMTEGFEFPFPKATIREGQTTPPAHHTEGTILHAMESAGEENMPEDAEHKGIGTPATRAAILEKLIETKLVERVGEKRKKVLIPTAKGKALTSILPDKLSSAQLTAEWEQRLGRIEQGQEKAEDFMRDIRQFVDELAHDTKRAKNAEQLFPPLREALGACPKCGAAITERAKGYMCENRTCSFALWKTGGILKDAEKPLTSGDVKELLEKGCVRKTGLRSAKTHTKYDATLHLDYNADGKPILRPTFD